MLSFSDKVPVLVDYKGEQVTIMIQRPGMALAGEINNILMRGSMRARQYLQVLEEGDIDKILEFADSNDRDEPEKEMLEAHARVIAQIEDVFTTEGPVNFLCPVRIDGERTGRTVSRTWCEMEMSDRMFWADKLDDLLVKPVLGRILKRASEEEEGNSEPQDDTGREE